MKNKKRLCLSMLMIFACAPAAFAQEHEVALLVGRLKPSDRGLDTLQPIRAAFDGAVSYEVNYANRIVDGELASLHWEITIAGAPSAGVKSTNLLLPKNYSSLFFTPGLKLKLFPGGGISPYIVGGVGVGRYAQSDTTVGGAPNTGDRANTTWAFNFGGGVDLNLLGPVAVRGEVRDFVTGNPSFSAPFLTNKQHNIFVGGGVVVKWK
ncbi:MAG: outer membrane protein [Blastocatellales bacterium]